MGGGFEGAGRDEGLEGLEGGIGGREGVLEVELLGEFGLEVAGVDEFEELESGWVASENCAIVN